MTEENWDELKSRLPESLHKAPPGGYFENLPDRMIQRWKAEEQNKKHVRRITLRKWIAVAAVSAGIVSGGVWWFKQDVSQIQASYSCAEAYQYVMENIDEFSSLMETQIPNESQDEIELPENTDVEEYLLDELEGYELEQLF